MSSCVEYPPPPPPREDATKSTVTFDDVRSSFDKNETRQPPAGCSATLKAGDRWRACSTVVVQLQ